jgi:hypothetical protein
MGGGRRTLLSKTSGNLGNVGSLWAFLTLGDLELHLIPFLQAFITFGSNRAVVHENIGSIFAPDKSIAFGIVEPLNCTFQPFHVRPLLQSPSLGGEGLS